MQGRARTASPIHPRRPALGTATAEVSVIELLQVCCTSGVAEGLVLVTYQVVCRERVGAGNAETHPETPGPGPGCNPEEAPSSRVRGDLPPRIPGREPRRDPRRGGRHQGCALPPFS